MRTHLEVSDVERLPGPSAGVQPRGSCGWLTPCPTQLAGQGVRGWGGPRPSRQ